MGFTTVAFYESDTGSATFNNVAGLADPHVTVSGDNITVPYINGQNPQIMYAAAGQTNASDTMAACQLSAPSLRGRTLLDVPNLIVGYFLTGQGGAMAPDTASTTYTFPQSAPVSWFLNSPMSLTPGENLQCLVQSSGTTAACLETIVVGLGDGNYINPYAGLPIETVRATSGTDSVAHAWTNVSLTMTQTLRAGRYALVGMKAFNTTMQAARAVLPESAHRPGCIGVTNISHRGDPLFRQGNLGIWGQFTHTSIPTIDVLSNAADTGVHTFFLDVVKIG